MNAYADTGFVVTLYKEEATSARAAVLMARQTAAVRLSQLGELEFRNALHLAVAGRDEEISRHALGRVGRQTMGGRKRDLPRCQRLCAACSACPTTRPLPTAAPSTSSSNRIGRGSNASSRASAASTTRSSASGTDGCGFFAALNIHTFRGFGIVVSGPAPGWGKSAKVCGALSGS